MTFLLWAALTFSGAIITLSWRGIDATFVPNEGDVKDFEGAYSVGLMFGHVTGWITSGTLVALIMGILVSYLFFLRVRNLR
jgi:hypothetical protein